MAARVRILITDRVWPELKIEEEIWKPLDPEIVEPPAHDAATIARMAVDVDAIAVCWDKVSPEALRGAKRCRIVARLGIGLDNIPLEVATELGMLVTNVPDYCVDEVAEHTLAVVLATARNIPIFHVQAKAGIYRLHVGREMHRVRGRTVGLLGLGRIAQAVAQRARGLGLNVLAWNRSGNSHGADVTMVSLDHLLANSDWVSVHLPSTPETRHLLRRPQFEKMKPTAWLINTSRGALLDQADLYQALVNNRLAGAALDVFDPEPPDLSQPLFRDERVIVTPHAAFHSAESVEELRIRVAHQILDTLQGRTPEGIVNQ